MPALAFLAVAPAVFVSAFILWRSGGEPAGPPAAAAATEAAAAALGTSEASTGPLDGSPGPAARETASPEPTPAGAPPPRALGVPVPEISASAAIVVDDASMEVLYGRDPYTPRPPASVTKMATAIVAMEQGRLDDIVTSDTHYWDLAYQADSTTMGLEPGDLVTLRDLLYGLMLVSGNDAASVIARHVSGSEEAFVQEMNRLAQRLGMKDTHWVTADGLSDPAHYSSPWDLVLLSRYLMRFPDLREIVGTEEYTARGVRDGGVIGYELYNHNPVLNYTPGVDGIKTGYTEEAGRTFSLTAERDGHRIYIVLLDSALRAQDAIALVEWAYENHVWPGQERPEASPTATPTATPAANQ